jgi:hypothetical protein
MTVPTQLTLLDPHDWPVHAPEPAGQPTDAGRGGEAPGACPDLPVLGEDHSIRFPPAQQQDLLPGGIVPGPPGVDLPTVRIALLTRDAAEGLIGVRHYRDEGNGDYKEGLGFVHEAVGAGAFPFTGDPIILDCSVPPRVLSGRPRLRAVIATGVPIVTAIVEGVDPRNAVVIDRHAKHHGRTFAGALPCVLASGAASITPHAEYLRLAGRSVLCWMQLTPERANASILHRETKGLPCRKLGKDSELVRDIELDRFRPTGQTVKFNTDNVMIDGVLRCRAVIATGIPVWVLVAYEIDARVPEAVLDVSRPSNYGHRMQSFDTSEGWDLQSSLRRLCRQAGIETPTQIDIQELHDRIPGYDNVMRRAKRHQHIVPQCVATPVRYHIGSMRGEAVADAFLDRILPSPADCRGMPAFRSFTRKASRGMRERELRAAEAVWKELRPFVEGRSKALPVGEADRLTNVFLQAFRIHAGEAERLTLPRGDRLIRLRRA